MEKKARNATDEPRIWDTVKQDFHKVTVDREIDIDLEDIIEFYLTPDQKKRLKEMKWYQKIYMIPAWLLKILFYKLTSIRRLLLLASFLCLFLSLNNKYLYLFLSFAILLFILILELKDKLIASDELIAGHAVQLSFMPPENPEIPGWSTWLYTKPANSVGGDMIDLLQLDSGRYGLALGDISGKELSAALYMVKLQSTIRAVAADCKTLSQLGKKVNTIFYRDSESVRFATMIYLELVANSGKIKFLNAGHLPPLVVKKGVISEAGKGSVALGVTKNTTYTEQNLTLYQGDMLVIFSDGITEAINKSGEFFGKERLKTLVERFKNANAQELGKEILSAINGFVRKEKFFDDLSVAILKKE